MKFLLTLILLVAGLVAQAQEAPYIWQPTTLNGGTNIVGRVTTNAGVFATNYYATNFFIPLFSAPESRNVAVNFQFRQNITNGTANTTSNVVFYVDASVDNRTWHTNWWIQSFAATGTNLVNDITNFDTYGVGYFRIGAIANLNTNTVTNVLVQVGKK